jgi:hypothetical protein
LGSEARACKEETIVLAVDSVLALDDTTPVMTADVLRLAVLKHMLNKVRELLSKARDVRYVSVPLWRPWRDF